MKPRLVAKAGEAAPALATDGTLLGGKVKFRQPAKGYRVAVDPLLLAAAVPAGDGERVLDLGAGAGAAALCLAMRVPGCRIDCLEAQEELARLAAGNVSANKLDRRIIVHVGDLRRPPSDLPRGGFDHVMTNPPYLSVEAAHLSKDGAPPDQSKRKATVDELGVAAWIDTALRFLKPRGRLTLIHRADRLDELIVALSPRLGEIAVIPLWPKAGEAARRVILRARKGVKSPARLSAGLVLHKDDGGFTDAADAVLRGGQALEG